MGQGRRQPVAGHLRVPGTGRPAADGPLPRRASRSPSRATSRPGTCATTINAGAFSSDAAGPLFAATMRPAGLAMRTPLKRLARAADLAAARGADPRAAGGDALDDRLRGDPRRGGARGRDQRQGRLRPDRRGDRPGRDARGQARLRGRRRAGPFAGLRRRRASSPSSSASTYAGRSTSPTIRRPPSRPEPWRSDSATGGAGPSASSRAPAPRPPLPGLRRAPLRLARDLHESGCAFRRTLA